MFECVKFVNTLPHIHTMKTLRDLLQGCCLEEAIVQAEIATPGTAVSFLRAAHLKRTRWTHQITAAALFILKRQAYDRWCHRHETDALDRDFEDWCHIRKHASPQFQYWATVLKLELLLLVYVHSLRQASFTMYFDALIELAPWFHALNHTNYATWIPIHLRDMAIAINVTSSICYRFVCFNSFIWPRSSDLVHLTSFIWPRSSDLVHLTSFIWPRFNFFPSEFEINHK